MRIILKNVKPYTTKTGKLMYFIETSTGDKYSTFEDLAQWQEGQELEGTIEDSSKINPQTNKPYQSFKFPNKTDILGEDVRQLKLGYRHLAERIEKLEGKKEVIKKETTENIPEFEPTADDIPF